MWSEKLSSNLKLGISSVLKRLKCSMRLRSDVSVFKRGLFKQVYWYQYMLREKSNSPETRLLDQLFEIKMNGNKTC